MEGSLDYINKQIISGWIFGDLRNLKLKIDDVQRADIKIKSISRPDVENQYPGKQAIGFEIESPKDLIDGLPHKVELIVKKDIINSPKVFSYSDEKILYIHIPKTGGSTILASLTGHKSHNFESHIQGFLLKAFDENGGYGREDLFSSRALKKAQQLIDKEKLINKNIDWLGGHVTPYQASLILNKFYKKKLFKSLLSEFSKTRFKKFNQHIEGFKLVSMVRDPIVQLISQLNWLYEIQTRGSKFLYGHEISALKNISFYTSTQSKSDLSILSRILNINLLNMQSKFVSPDLFINPTKKTALNEIKKFHYIGRMENISGMVKKVTYPTNDFPLLHSNLTTNKYYSIDDLKGPLKDYIYEKMKPDFLLYEAVNEYFG